MGQEDEVCSRVSSWLCVTYEAGKRLDGIQILISNFQEVIINNWREGCFKSCLMWVFTCWQGSAFPINTTLHPMEWSCNVERVCVTCKEKRWRKSSEGNLEPEHLAWKMGEIELPSFYTFWNWWWTFWMVVFLLIYIFALPLGIKCALQRIVQSI